MEQFDGAAVCRLIDSNRGEVRVDGSPPFEWSSPILAGLGDNTPAPSFTVPVAG